MMAVRFNATRDAVGCRTGQGGERGVQDGLSGARDPGHGRQAELPACRNHHG